VCDVVHTGKKVHLRAATGVFANLPRHRDLGHLGPAGAALEKPCPSYGGTNGSNRRRSSGESDANLTLGAHCPIPSVDDIPSQGNPELLEGVMRAGFPTSSRELRARSAARLGRDAQGASTSRSRSPHLAQTNGFRPRRRRRQVDRARNEGGSKKTSPTCPRHLSLPRRRRCQRKQMAMSGNEVGVS
jgi:hypothetical protein